MNNIATAALFCVPTLVYVLVKRRTPAAARRLMGLTLGERTDYLWTALATVVLGALAFATTLVIPADIIGSAGATNRITTLVVGVGVALRSAAEEVLFRGFFQGLLARKFGRWPGIVLQALLFLLPHLVILTAGMQLWPILPIQFVVGVILGWVRSRHDSVLPGALSHALVNVVAGLLL